MSFCEYILPENARAEMVRNEALKPAVERMDEKNANVRTLKRKRWEMLAEESKAEDESGRKLLQVSKEAHEQRNAFFKMVKERQRPIKEEIAHLKAAWKAAQKAKSSPSPSIQKKASPINGKSPVPNKATTPLADRIKYYTEEELECRLTSALRKLQEDNKQKRTEYKQLEDTLAATLRKCQEEYDSRAKKTKSEFEDLQKEAGLARRECIDCLRDLVADDGHTYYQVLISDQYESNDQKHFRQMIGQIPFKK
jgi:hypothetical protein